MQKQHKSEGDINISPLRNKWQDQHIDAATKALLKEDERYFLHQSLSTPCLNALKSCDGIYIEDLQGNRYMDFHGNNVHQVGFANPEVLDAIKRQLDTLSFCTRRYTNRVAVDLAKKLAQLAPGDLGKTLFCPGGAEAIGIALKLARLVTGRHKTISMWDSFHGATLDTISIGGEAVFRQDQGPLLPGTEHVPAPDPSRAFFDLGDAHRWEMFCARYVEYILEQEGDIAAVISEPMRSTPYVPSAEYWQTIRKACDKHGALLIFDEIPHALGRTGKMFTCENFDVTPDILCIGKGLGGGVFPLAAMIASERLDVVGHRALGHYTHEKNPVACAAALATINAIESNDLLAHSRQLGRYAMKRLGEIQKRHPLIGDVRGIGLFLGIELLKDGRHALDEAEKVMYCALSKGVSFKLTMGNIITLTPALIITEKEMDQALDSIEDCIGQVESGTI